MSAPALLWVDDEADALDSGATLLRLDGFRVDFATTVGVAIAMAEARGYDGVLLDLLLPDGSGLDVLRAIRKRRSMPVAILSGHLDFEAALAAGRLDVLEVWRKPLIGDDLVGLARRLTTGAPSRFDGLRSVEACLRSLGSRPADERVRANEILRDALLSPSLSTVDFLTVCRMVGATRDGRSPLLVLDAAASMYERLDDDGRSTLAKLEASFDRARDVNLAALATKWGLDERELSDRIKAVTGDRIRRLRLAAKVRPSMEGILRSNEQIAQIAYRIGYTWPTQFDRDFKAVFGMTPTECRRFLGC